jgi:hypothetical protein
VLVAAAFSSAVGTSCSTGSAEAPVTTTSIGSTEPTADNAVEQRCMVLFQTPLPGQTSARRTVILIETGEEVAVFEAGKEMPPLTEIAGCQPE